MYSKKSGYVLAFHGCDESVRNSVVNGENLRPSINSYDWLGNGIYFWESDPLRAYEWAVMLSKRAGTSIKKPSVLGAIIDLGNCLDLTNRENILVLQDAYEMVKENCLMNGYPMPENKNVAGNKDLLYRHLDCAVIQMVHSLVKKTEGADSQYDSVRGLFLEGKPAYEGSGFSEKTHTQICIVNPNCIKGYFLPREKDLSFPNP